MIIAIDGMGGDNAPDIIILGINHFLLSKDFSNNSCDQDLSLRVFGKKQILSDRAKALGVDIDALIKKSGVHIDIVNSDEVVSQDETVENIKKLKNTSMGMMLHDLKANNSDIGVSAGNTKILMSMSVLTLGRLKQINRPAICGFLPNAKHKQTIITDLGANIECKDVQYLDFCIMSVAFAKAYLSIESPKVGILNVGTEDNKGTKELKSAFQLIKNSNLDIQFQGFVEGSDILTGNTDIIITDGFTGNVVLKTLEGSASFVEFLARERIASMSFIEKILTLIPLKIFITPIKNKINYRKYNGAGILGLRKPVVKSHGHSDYLAFSNALNLSYTLQKNDISSNINNYISNIDSGTA